MDRFKVEFSGPVCANTNSALNFNNSLNFNYVEASRTTRLIVTDYL